MKKYLVYLIALPVALLSCVGTEDDLFDKSAAERINESMTEYDRLLKSAENGWIVEYYPEAGRAYGGYNLWFKFEDNEIATVGSELHGYDLAQSLYSIKSDRGPTLNFDSYNPILNFFSDPSANYGGGPGLGLEGDYEFVMVGGTEYEIVMKGKKTLNTIRMTPLPATTTWEDYVDMIDDMYELGTASKYLMTVGGREIEKITRSYNNFSLTYNQASEQDDDADMAYASAPYIYTTTGIKFYEPVEIYGQTMQEFTLDVAAGVYNAVGADAQIILQFVPINETFVATQSLWEFAEFGTTLNNLLNAAASAVASKEGDQYAGAAIGWYESDEYTGMSLIFVFQYKGEYYGAGYILEVAPVENTTDQVKLTITGTFLNGDYYFAYLNDFLTAIEGTYTLTPDDTINPAVITFTNVSDPSSYFTVEL